MKRGIGISYLPANLLIFRGRVNINEEPPGLLLVEALVT